MCIINIRDRQTKADTKHQKISFKKEFKKVLDKLKKPDIMNKRDCEM